MSLPWSATQIEWLQAMGLDVLQRPPQTAAAGGSHGATASTAHDIPPGLRRAAAGIDLGPLLAVAGVPRDVASRRAFWRQLRAHRKAARRG